MEELINRSNEQYAKKGLALIQKIPTPITPVRIDKERMDYLTGRTNVKQAYPKE